MIRLSDSATPKTNSPWRRRIPNQLAAIAAIMLFASTQVSAPEKGLEMAAAKGQVVAQGVMSEISAPQLDLAASLDQAGGEKSRKKAGSKKTSFKLNLFRFRR